MLTPEGQILIEEEERKRIAAEMVRAEVGAALGTGTSSIPDQELQREKLLPDIRDLKRPWWQKASYIAALAPVFLGSLTVFVGYQTGYFNALNERLTAQRVILDRDVRDFTNQRDELGAELKSLSHERDTLSAENTKLRDTARQLTEKTSRLQDKLILAPFEADINRLIELASAKLSVANVQKLVDATLGTSPNPELDAPFNRVSKALLIKDSYHDQRIGLLKKATDAQKAAEVHKVLSGAAAGRSLNSLYSTCAGVGCTAK